MDLPADRLRAAARRARHLRSAGNQGCKAGRHGDFGMQTVQGNGVSLAWAPRGPGWADDGVTWDEAQEICKYLSEDGLTIMETEQNIWRLPGVDEAVRSMMLHGENAGGVWDASETVATYEKRPTRSPRFGTYTPRSSTIGRATRPRRILSAPASSCTAAAVMH